MNETVLDFFMLVITYLGDYILILSLTALSALSFLAHKHWHRILPLFISVGGSSLSVFWLKYFFNLPRPLEAFYLEQTPSFPSMHASLAIAFYGFIFYVIWKHDKHYLKKSLGIFLVLIIILIGMSRLYLEVHYLFDVLVGYLIGIIWLGISIFTNNKIEKLLIWKLISRN
ncbi:MAG: phosphatase PAP2 family protein [Candidatus Zambryskibacteria bacterium]|nr:phosphatase PAP2 family protein [Candidatus Zambryskibacteria bacterium]